MSCNILYLLLELELFDICSFTKVISIATYVLYIFVVYSVRKFTTVRVVMVLKFYLKFRHRGMYCMTDDILVLYK